MPLAGCSRAFRCAALGAALLVIAGGLVTLGAQEQATTGSSEQVGEVVATLASGQVTVIVAQGGLVVVAVGNQFEPGDLPPLIVPLGSLDIAALMGAVDWIQPPGNRTLLRLDARLPRLAGGANQNIPRLTAGANLPPPEQIGLGVLDPLRAAASTIHTQLDLPSDFRLVDLVFIHEPPDGSQPQIWDFGYSIRQTFLEQDFWDTQVGRPSETLVYPDKENGSSMMAISYPPEEGSPGLIDWLDHPTGRLAQTVELDSKMAKAQHSIASGEVRKVHLAELVPLVKTTLEAMASPSAGASMAMIDNERGFSWVIPPPATVLRERQNARPAGVPTLQPTHPF